MFTFDILTFFYRFITKQLEAGKLYGNIDYISESTKSAQIFKLKKKFEWEIFEVLKMMLDWTI